MGVVVQRAADRARREHARSPLRSLTPAGLAVVLFGAALAAWLIAIDRMRGLDAGPGTDLGSIGWWVGIWVTMMAAILLPSVTPTALAFARASRERGAGGAQLQTGIFLAGYLAVGTAYGLLAYGVYRLVVAGDTGWLAWDRAGPYVAGGAVVAAGVYQLTPLEEHCLRRCREPERFVRERWRPGRVGALRMGVVHGLYWVGCCAGLLAILFAVGALSLVWMAVIAAVVFAETTLPFGRRLARVLAVVFVGLGIWIAVAPASAPGLVDPAKAPAGSETPGGGTRTPTTPPLGGTGAVPSDDEGMSPQGNRPGRDHMAP
jgi:predicted metal-binding membrane protein